MAARVAQTFANHRRIVFFYHVVLTLILLINLGWRIYALIRDFSLAGVVDLLVAIGLLIIGAFLRFWPLTAQDRLIRLEERLRLERLLPEETRGRIGELSTKQLIALRFADDGEVAELVARVLAGDLSGQTEIKKAIRTWRPDYLRV